jgi:5'-deoxynucleotidase YfbR-like HD superfamily hydrolase
MKELLQFIMEGGSVVRYHTRPGIKPDTDAHHSHGVAMLCSILAGERSDGGTRARAELLMAALTHDLAEQLASDVNANTKRVLGVAAELGALEDGELQRRGLSYFWLLSEEERAILHLADLFDRMLYCCRELALGNKNMLLIWRNTCRDVARACAGTDHLELSLRACTVYEAIKEIYHETIGPSGPSFDVFAGVPDAAPRVLRFAKDK